MLHVFISISVEKQMLGRLREFNLMVDNLRKRQNKSIFGTHLWHHHENSGPRSSQPPWWRHDRSQAKLMTSHPHFHLLIITPSLSISIVMRMKYCFVQWNIQAPCDISHAPLHQCLPKKQGSKKDMCRNAEIMNGDRLHCTVLITSYES